MISISRLVYKGHIHLTPKLSQPTLAHPFLPATLSSYLRTGVAGPVAAGWHAVLATLPALVGAAGAI